MITSIANIIFYIFHETCQGYHCRATPALRLYFFRATTNLSGIPVDLASYSDKK